VLLAHTNTSRCLFILEIRHPRHPENEHGDGLLCERAVDIPKIAHTNRDRTLRSGILHIRRHKVLKELKL